MTVSNLAVLFAICLFWLMTESSSARLHDFKRIFASAMIATCTLTYPTFISSVGIAQSVERNGIQYTKSSSGISYYDYPNKFSSEVNQNDVAKVGSTVVLDIKGYLAGRNGWQFIDTKAVEDGEIRLVLGKTPMIKGLEIGI